MTYLGPGKSCSGEATREGCGGRTEMKSMMGAFDISNKPFLQAVDFICQTNRHLFLTGKAGTGKTTFLKFIRENCFKKLAVVAPTGVAAINAGGVTIHSFFQLPFGMYLQTHPSAWGEVDTSIYNENQLLGKLHLSAPKRELIRELDLLIIDEVSMVRADLLDAIDTVLRSVRRRHHDPFGGVQMLYIGDLFQLPPVIKDKERELFDSAYESPFFFDAKALETAPPLFIELKKIYRQKDEHFIRILNHVRNSTCTEEDLNTLHDSYQPHFAPAREEGYITLTTHNYKADDMNRKQLEQLPGKTHHFPCEIKGEFPENAYPAAASLELKEGAQIMFIKNDKGEDRRYYNGKIGLVKRIDAHGKNIFVSFPNESTIVELPMEIWSNVRFKYDADKDAVIEEELGTFSQYPIRLAWAVTIHKSQGLTFEKAIVDAGSSFAPGQVYVALSRLTSLTGLVLRSRISPQDIRTDERILTFSSHEPTEEFLDQALDDCQQDFFRKSLLEVFDWGKLVEKTNQTVLAGRGAHVPDRKKEMTWLNTLKEAVLFQQDTARKFRTQLEQLLTSGEDGGYGPLYDRTRKAVDWFTGILEERVDKPLESHIPEIKKLKVKKLTKSLQDLRPLFARKLQQVRLAGKITEALQSDLGQRRIMELVAELHKPMQPDPLPADQPAPKREKGASRQVSLALYKEGKNVQQIAAERQLTENTIVGHLIEFIPTGEVDIRFLVKPERLEQLLTVIRADPGARLSVIREKMGFDFTFSEIKASSLYYQRENGAEVSAK